MRDAGRRMADGGWATRDGSFAVFSFAVLRFAVSQFRSSAVPQFAAPAFKV
jgi:hypothetical protein